MHGLHGTTAVYPTHLSYLVEVNEKKTRLHQFKCKGGYSRKKVIEASKGNYVRATMDTEVAPRSNKAAPIFILVLWYRPPVGVRVQIGVTGTIWFRRRPVDPSTSRWTYNRGGSRNSWRGWGVQGPRKDRSVMGIFKFSNWQAKKEKLCMREVNPHRSAAAQDKPRTYMYRPATCGTGYGPHST